MKLIRTGFVFLITVILFSWYSCDDGSYLNPNHSPLAAFTFSPENADTMTVFTFDASQSSDVEDLVGKLTFSWDFEGRQIWTDAVNNPIANYKFSKAGIFNVGLKVFDSEGWSDQTRKNVIVKDSVKKY